jgi:hypothetical protein
MDTTKIDENIGNDSIDSIDGVLNTILAAFSNQYTNSATTNRHFRIKLS